MITEDSISFLKSIPPFQFLDSSTIKIIADNLSLEFFPKGSMILVEDGPPSDSLRIVKKGGVKIYLSSDDDMVIDYRSEGDSFGYLSLINGDKSRANVQAVEDTLCYLIPREIILKIISTEPVFGEYFMKTFFKNYLDKTYKEMRDRNILFKEGEKLLYTTLIKDLVYKDAITETVDATIKDAAGIMSRHEISSLVLLDGHDIPIGIITDRDLRDKVVSKAVDPASPVKEIMSPNLVTVDAGKTCFDALATMIKFNIHHLLVTENNKLIGVVTNHDFMILQGTSPLSILKNIDRQTNAEDLLAIYEKISQISLMLLKEGVRTTHVMRIITELNDRLLKKIIELSIEEIGNPDHTFAFFVYASEGRKEQTFKSPFHCGIVYENVSSYDQKQEIEAFCSKFIRYLESIFIKCGLPVFDIHPLGENTHIYREISDWENDIINSLNSSNSIYAFKARTLLDARTIYGNESLVTSLRDRLYKRIMKDEKFSSALYIHQTKQKSPVGFFRHFVMDSNGEQTEQFNVKEKGINQIVDALRAMAVMFNINETSTLERLDILSRRGHIPSDLRNDVAASLEFLLHLLLHHQMVEKESSMELDDTIDPEKMSLLEKKTLKEVFQIIPVLRSTMDNAFKRLKAMA